MLGQTPLVKHRILSPHKPKHEPNQHRNDHHHCNNKELWESGGLGLVSANVISHMDRNIRLPADEVLVVGVGVEGPLLVEYANPIVILANDFLPELRRPSYLMMIALLRKVLPETVCRSLNVGLRRQMVVSSVVRNWIGARHQGIFTMICRNNLLLSTTNS